MAQEKLFSLEAAVGPKVANRILYSNGSFGKPFDDEGPILTYEATLRSFFSLSEEWSVGLGVTYSKKGFNAGNVSFMDENGEASYVLENFLIVVNYIEVPILAKYNFLKNEYLQLYGQLGLSPNFYLKSNYIYTDKNGEVNYI